MKIYNKQDFKRLEDYTCKIQRITLGELMERAIGTYCDWFLRKADYTPGNILVVAGPGNNGGDAIGVAGTLHSKGYSVKLLILDFNSTIAELQQTQLKKYQSGLTYATWKIGDTMPVYEDIDTVIDGIFGYGLSRPLEGDILTFVKYLNGLHATRYAIDIPSGTFADLRPSEHSFQAHYTLTFHSPKQAFLLAENSENIGEWDIGDIQLEEENFQPEHAYYHYYMSRDALQVMPRRKRFDHKGTYGHSFLISGQVGMVGCALLAGEACLRTGAGKLTIHCPSIASVIVQMGLPEAMISEDKERDFISSLPDLAGYEAIGIGPGIGTRKQTESFLNELLTQRSVPLILDADALNILSGWENWQELLREDDIILPHPGEFDRLFGEHKTHFERVETLEKMHNKFPFTIVLKGAYTSVAQKNKPISFNSSGNPGMATAGSGDVLTGMITSLVGQGMNSYEAARLGIYLHGLAGDIYVSHADMASLIAGDIVKNIGLAMRLVWEENNPL